MRKKIMGQPIKYGKDYIDDKYLIDRHKFTPMVIPPTMINFSGTTEPTVCSVFGCRNHLTTEQKLYGTKCIHHQKQKKIDITLFISQSKIA
jgi:hypothetical protein